MGKLFLITCITLLAFLMTGALFAQPESLMNINTLGTYNMGAFQTDRERNDARIFWERMNADMAIYNNSPLNKMGNGFLNASTSWADIFYGVAKTSAEDNVLSGITFGLGAGVASGVTRLAAGTVDMATFAFPPYDEPLMEPAYAVKPPPQEFKINLLEW